MVRRNCQNGRGSGNTQGKAPFIVLPRVHEFQFRVLRQNRPLFFLFYFAQPQPHPLKSFLNRRVVQDQARIQEIENFHHVLTDISYCECTARVRQFIVDAYVRGAQKSGGTAEYTQLEGNTAVFTKRSFFMLVPFASTQNTHTQKKEIQRRLEQARVAKGIEKPQSFG